MAEANADITNRLITKVGTGIATVPPSADHRNGDWVETDIYDGELYMNLTDGKLYTSNSGVVQEIGASSPDTNLGNTNLTADANRTYTLNGSLSSDTLAFKTGGGIDVLSVRGDDTIYIPTGRVGIGNAPNSVTKLIINSTGLNYGFRDIGSPTTANFYAVNPSKVGFLAGQVQDGGEGMRSETTITSGGCELYKANLPVTVSTANVVGVESSANVSGTATGGTLKGFKTHLRNSSANNIGIEFNISGAVGDNVAVDIIAGDIRVPTGALGFTGTGTYTTLTIEKGIITNAV